MWRCPSTSSIGTEATSTLALLAALSATIAGKPSWRQTSYKSTRRGIQMGSWSESSPVLGAGRSSGRIFDRPVVTWAKMLQRNTQTSTFSFNFWIFYQIKSKLEKIQFSIFHKKCWKEPEKYCQSKNFFWSKKKFTGTGEVPVPVSFKSKPVRYRYRFKQFNSRYLNSIYATFHII